MSRPDPDLPAHPEYRGGPGDPPFENGDLTLRRRVDELERELERLKRAPPAHPLEAPNARTLIRQRLRRILLALLVATAGVPPALVLLDRWMGRPISSEPLHDLWCRSAFLCELSLPSYFPLIPLCFGALAFMIWVWRREPRIVFSNLSLGRAFPAAASTGTGQVLTSTVLLALAGLALAIIIPLAIATGRIPGWDLIIALALYAAGWVVREVDLGALLRTLRERRGYYLALILFHLGLCAALFALFSNSGGTWMFFILFAGASLNLLPYAKRVPAVYWIMSISLVALTWALNAWQYMAIGDEYSFFYAVHKFIQNERLLDIGSQLFRGQFVYETHPYFSSVIQAVFMRLFGYHNFGWRFSNPYLSAASLPLFYYFFKTFFTRRVAIAATLITGISHYLISFSKIGYNNLQALFAMALVLALAAWALRSMRYLAFVLLGLSIGFCFYVYPAALYVVPLPLILVMLFAPPTSKRVLLRWSVMLLSTILLVFPLFRQPGYWMAKIPGTFYFSPQLASSGGALLRHSSENIIYSLFSFLYIPQESHYVSTAYMGPLSGALIMIGMAYGAKLVVKRDRVMAFLTISFLLFLVFVGASHDRRYPSATRMFLFLPWFGLYAAIGWAWLHDVASDTLRGVLNVSRTLVPLLAALVAVNLYQAYRIDIQRMQRYHDLGPLFLRTLRQIESHPDIPPKTTVFISDPSWNADGMEVLVDVYQTPPSIRQIESLTIDEPRLSEASLEDLSQPDKLVIIKPWLDEEWKEILGGQLEQVGKVACAIKTESGDLRFLLWHSGDLGWLCP